MNTTKKHYEVYAEEPKTWNILFNHVIDKSKFIEFGIGVDFTQSPTEKLDALGLPQSLKEDRSTQIKNAVDDLALIGLQDNIVHFYSTKTIFNSDFSRDWHMARLQLDEKLKTVLKAKETLMDIVDLEINDYLIDFNYPAFYKDDETVLMFCDHIEMNVFILLDEQEKVELENQGVRFIGEIEQVFPVGKKDVVTLEEIKKL